MKKYFLSFLLIPVTILPFIEQNKLIAMTGSMEPAIHSGDVLVVDEAYYSSNPVQRFDIVVLETELVDQAKGAIPPKTMKVAIRVAGMGGETIALKNNKLIINGEEMNEPYVTAPCPQEDQIFPCANYGPIKIPDGEFFLLGDNRAHSEDSRYWKPSTVAQKRIIGKVTKVISAQ